jgi:hypothetical protein
MFATRVLFIASAVLPAQGKSQRGASSDVPSLVSVATNLLSAVTPCPASLPWDCSTGAIQLTLTGSLFGSAPGAGGGVDIAAAVAPPTPAPEPDDLPDALSMDPDTPTLEFAWAATSGGCLRPSDGASNDFSFEVCPYGTSYLRTRGGGARVASLGAFAGVVRRYEEACDDPPPTGLLAVTGLLFQGGDACGTGTFSAQVNFVCSSAANPFFSRFSDNTTVSAATVSADGCAWQLDVPLSDACFEDDDLCSEEVNPPPNPVPAPMPFTFSSAFVSAWAPGAITVLAPPAATGTAPGVRAVRVRRYDGAVTALVAPLPAPLPPSASPIPAPFPAQLTVLGATPAAGLSFATGEPLPPDFRSQPPCRNGPVIISLGGVEPSDLEGFEAGFEISFPRNNVGFREPLSLYGAPLGANATVTRVPSNGRLDLMLDCAPFLLDGFPTPHVGEFTVRSRFRANSSIATATTRRTAVCAPGACTWTFLGPVAPAPAPAAAPAALSGPALYGAIGGGIAGLLAIVAAGVVAYFRCGGAKGGGKGAPPAPSPPRAAWAPNAAIEMNPVAVALNASPRADGGGAGPVEWGSK